MQRLLDRLDDIFNTNTIAPKTAWIERAMFVFLVLMVVSAPHSIAATQTAWLIGMALWVARLVVGPRPRFRLGALDVALWGFFIWSAISSAVSYEPLISIDKLRGVSVFLIFYFVFCVIRTQRAVRFVALALIASCMVNVLWVPIERLIGRGVEVHGVVKGGPIEQALLIDGDTLLEANGVKLTSPEDLIRVLDSAETARVRFYRPDFEFAVEVKRSKMLAGTTAGERLGFASWSKSHNWRSSGFFGHYATYAEVLQLILSLLFGIIAAGIKRSAGRPAQLPLALLFAAFAAMCLALLLTVTRASQLAFMISAFTIVLLAANRRLMLAAAVLAVPIVLGGLMFLQQSRMVGFFDPADESTRYRTVMWQDGVRLWTADAHNFIFGVGMDSIKRHWQEWGLFEGGKLPMGHFHSTPVQLITERGLPALLLWLAVIGIYLWRLFSAIRHRPPDRDPLLHGILLGCLGGAVGFFVSGLVHYNLGDQEVAMVFYLLMGLSLRTAELSPPDANA